MDRSRDDAGSNALPPRVWLSRLQLSDFRNYPALSMELGPGPVVLTGENGAGKTNLLEAVSFLSPGRGLRRAKLAEVTRAGSSTGFSIHARVEGPHGGALLGTGTSPGATGPEPARRVRINGANARADEMLEWLRIMWITPAMDGLFTGPSADRRRFLDRLVLTIDPEHGRRATDYERAMKSRNRLLDEGSRNWAWFEAIEEQMAATGVAIAAARCEMVRLLALKLGELNELGPFPMAGLALAGMLEEMIGRGPAIDAETAFRRELATGRERDRAAGRSLAGPHRSDLLVTHVPKSMPASLCSTGEQKALLVGIVLSHARLTGEIAGMAPILLLDEIGAHLDQPRRRSLFEILNALNCQAFATGTDAGIFRNIGENAELLRIADGCVFRIQD